jgi:glycosyltransferase involved in cell wall biosynthesis
LYKLYRCLRPDIVHHITAKPVLYGTLMARVTDIPCVVNAVPGLGFVFIAEGVKGSLRRKALELAYYTLLRHPNMEVIFQNTDDLQHFLSHHMVRTEQCQLIKGSGVDLSNFHPKTEPGGIPVVILPSRMLTDKGVREFAIAARQLRDLGVAARLALVGDCDPGNPASLSDITINNWVSEGILEWWGYRSDMSAVMSQAHVICLPSYREGLPKVLAEAAAAGRAIVTTDVPGCRDVVDDGQTGLLVPPRDADALARALKRLIEDPTLRQEMGTRGRAKAERDFDIAEVVATHIQMYEKLRFAISRP